MGSLILFHLVRCSPWPSLVCDKIQAVCPHPRLIGRSRDKLKGKNRWRGSCHSQWLSRGRKRRFGIPQEMRDEERGHRNTADVLLFSLRTGSVPGSWTTRFSCAGWAGTSTACLDGERLQEIPTLDCFLTFPLLEEKHQASLEEITDDPGHLSLKLLGSE